VSTDEQADSGLGLDAQRAAIEGETTRRGWELVHVFTDTASGRSLSRRPRLDEALAMLESGGAAAMIVSKLDRLSRSHEGFRDVDGTGSTPRMGTRRVGSWR
jgi:DNA invertase Pin-like site-specific DNA recombinase